MKKLTVLAMLAAVLMAGSAFAVTRHITPQGSFSGVGATVPAAGGALAGGAAGPSTTNNDDSCDIGTAPAATLLLPFFDVDFKSPQGTARTTLFTITNVSNLPQIAHVVIWTDWSFPAIDFNIFLTGYDVQPINLYDIFARGVIAPMSGTSNTTAEPANPTAGSQPACGGAGLPACPAGAPVPINLATTNPNITSFANCTNLPGAIPPGLLSDLQSVFTTGFSGNVAIPCASTTKVGGTHTDAIGYITVDVNANCNTSLPNVATYFTTNILFDNVLVGDYENIQPNPAVVNAAGGSPMVHIRAIPEGGGVGSLTTPPAVPTNLPDTFYDRYTQQTPQVIDRRADRRQPLPSLFAARWINGGTGSFNTNFQIWREGFTTGLCATTTAANGAIGNSLIPFTELVRFDEHENAATQAGGTIISPAPPALGLPETSSQPTSGAVFPAAPAAAGDVGGWMYLNLNAGANPIATGYSRDNSTVAAQLALRASQNWVTVNMQAESRFSVLFDAAWLGNGCSPPAGSSTVTQIGPAGGVLVCPPPLAVGAGCPAGAPAGVGTNTTPP